jgi:hypothetical protein
VELFENIIHKDNITLHMDVTTEPKTILQFIESWRIKLWDKAFLTVFKGADHFKKSDSFKDFKGSDLVVKRVVYRYAVTLTLSCFTLCYSLKVLILLTYIEI